MFRKYHPKPGARPGTLLITPDAVETRIRYVKYSFAKCESESVDSVDQLPQNLSADEVIWIDLQGFKDEASLQEIAERFEIHPLAMEDVVNVPQRSKAEQYDDQTLIIARLVLAIGYGLFTLLRKVEILRVFRAPRRLVPQSAVVRTRALLRGLEAPKVVR